MKIKYYELKVTIASCLLLLISSCKDKTYNAIEPNAIVQQASIEEQTSHGEYLVNIMGCNDCHSPKQMGKNGPEIIPELMLSGYPADRPIIKFTDPLIKVGFALFYPDQTAAAGPWGVTFAGNLTPDNTGIGNWTEEQFKKALTQGKYKGLDNTRMLLPPMPWFNYTQLTDKDVNAIFSYLKSIKPVRNIVPSPVSPDKM
jgi:hypothetical protein